MALVVLAISVLIALAIGVPRAWLFVTAWLLAWPIQCIVMFVTVRLFPVELEATGDSGDFRGVLYAERDAVIAGAPEVPAPSPDIQFAASRKSWTFGDLAIGLFLAAIMLGFGYWSVSPLIAMVFPQYGAIRTGPNGFPVTIHIGHRLIAFTNGSAVSWTCRATLMSGGRPIAAAVFPVEAGRTHGVFYSDFLEAHGSSDDALEEAARDRVALLCQEPSGRRHFATIAPPWQIR